MEEAHLGRVTDPAAGSGYVEALTDEIARAAWTRFQAIEAMGGLIEALARGLISEDVVKTLTARPTSPKIVGITAFPPSDQDPVEVEQPTIRHAEAPSPRLPGPDSHCPPLTPIRLSQAYEGAK